jgi:hypothetical protein
LIQEQKGLGCSKTFTYDGDSHQMTDKSKNPDGKG